MWTVPENERGMGRLALGWAIRCDTAKQGSKSSGSLLHRAFDWRCVLSGAKKLVAWWAGHFFSTHHTAASWQESQETHSEVQSSPGASPMTCGRAMISECLTVCMLFCVALGKIQADRVLRLGKAMSLLLW